MHYFIHRVLMTVAVPLRVKIMHKILSRLSWERTEIKQYQEEKMRNTVKYCWEYVPFYREKWKNYISDPSEIQRIEDLEKLPIISKDEFRDNTHQLISTAPGLKSCEGRTGGSTGSPIIFRTNHEDDETCWGQMYTGWSWAGYRLGDPFLVIGGESVGVGKGDKRNWKDFILNRWITSGSNITRERVEYLCCQPVFKKIKIIYGYPNSIREFGEHLRALGLQFPKLEGIVCTAEVMRTEIRNRIADLYGVRNIVDQWGLADGGLQACEGPEQDGLHLHFHSGLLEIVNNQAKQITKFGDVGRGIATSLTNRATPFVRYETGDMLHWYKAEPSPSGIGWPRIGPVDGRSGDVIYLPSGRSIPMPGLTLVMRWIEGLHDYQFIQTSRDQVVVRLNPGKNFTLRKSEAIKYLQEKISDEVDWKVEFAAPVLTNNGKLLIIRNDWLRDQGLSRPN